MTMFIYTCYASDSDTEVRVRIRSPRSYNEKLELHGSDKINVYNILESRELPIAILDKSINVFLDTYYSHNYLTQDGNSSDSIIGPYHLKLIDYEYNDFDSASSEAARLSANYDFNFYPFYNGKTFNIYAGNFLSNEESSRNGDILIQSGISCETINGNNQLILVTNFDKKPILMYNNNFNIYFSSYNPEINCRAITIDKKLYRGEAAVHISENRLISINRVNLKYYLYGVIPNEVLASWHQEAIKAQVLAARSYVVSLINPNSKNGYDVQDNQNDQVYGGYNTEKAATNIYIDETDGEMIYYDGKVITAYYHSTSGGRTENSENIWFSVVPYLRAVDDPYSNKSPLNTWQYSLRKEEILAIAQGIKPAARELYDVVITDISENGRVLECIISTDAGDIILKKEDVRATIGYRTLPSSWFEITTNNDVFLISGNGFVPKDDNEKEDPSEDDSDNSSGDSLIDDNEKDNNSQNSENNTNIENKNSENLRVSLSGKKLISSSGISNIGSGSLSFISSSGVSSFSSSSIVYNFVGRGNGHGIGMSQYGALKMAEEGYTYEQILKHYFTGVEIR